MITILILWILSGFIIGLFGLYFENNGLKIKDIIIGLALSFFGPITIIPAIKCYIQNCIKIS